MRLFFVILSLTAALFAAEDWTAELKSLSEVQRWERAAAVRPQVTSEAIDQALEAARLYMINQQLPEGNFRYALDITDNFEIDDDNQVRQAGALWGLSNLNRERFTEESRRAVLLGLDFFMHNQRPLPGGALKVITYKAQRTIKTGTVALFTLALVDFLTGQEKYIRPAQLKPYLDCLYDNLSFLQMMELPNGSWRESYNVDNPPFPGDLEEFSPYYDGESLLAYLCAAKYYAARPELRAPAGLMARVEDALPKLLQRYVVDALKPDGDSSLTKGFFQWGLMSCALFCETHDGASAELALNGALALSWWQIFGNRLDTRNGNTGYAVEGLVSAWILATKFHRTAEAEMLREAVDNTLAKLMTWQVGGPFEHLNPFLQFWKKTIPQRAFGGVTSNADSGIVRIDIVQHQIHAMLMAQKYLYSNKEK